MNWLVTNTVLALVLALVVELVCRCARPRPAFAHALWALVLLRLCWPPGCAFELPLGFLARVVPWPAASAPAPLPAPATVPAAAPAAAAPGVASPAARRVSIDPYASVEPDATVEPHASVAMLATAATPGAVRAAADGGFPAAGTALIAPGGVLVWLWAAGSTAFAVLAAVGIARGRRRYGAAPPCAPWVAREVAALASQLGVRAPLVADDPSATTPFVWPFGRPRLVASTTSLAAMRPAARAAVLAHELGHLARRDHWWLHGELLLATLFCWHPLFWLLRARLREQAELACDAWALWAAPAARRPYAEALIAALEQEHPAPALPILAARPGARRLIERRLSMILHESVPCRLSRLALAGLAMLSLGLVIAPVRGQERADRPKVEIIVGGKRLEDMTPAQRQRVLRQLGVTGEALELVLRARSVEAGAEDDRQEQEPAPQPKPRGRPTPSGRPTPDGRPRNQQPQGDRDAAGADLSAEIRATLHSALDEARREIGADRDLKELGITDDVLGLVDSIGGKGDFQQSLDQVIGGALRGAAKMARKDLAHDPDLQKLGIADSVGKLIEGLADNEQFRSGLMDVARKAMHGALAEARVEIGNDAELRELGIADDLGALLDDLGNGKLDLERHLPALIQKAMRAGLERAHAELHERGDGDADRDEPAAKPKTKAKDRSKDKAKSQPK